MEGCFGINKEGFGSGLGLFFKQCLESNIDSYFGGHIVALINYLGKDLFCLTEIYRNSEADCELS